MTMFSRGPKRVPTPVLAGPAGFIKDRGGVTKIVKGRKGGRALASPQSYSFYILSPPDSPTGPFCAWAALLDRRLLPSLPYLRTNTYTSLCQQPG
jgi:hypothetical protein